MADPKAVRQAVERHVRVYEAKSEKMPGGGDAHLFFIMAAPGELEARVAAIRTDIQAIDPELLVVVRHEGGEDTILIVPRPPPPPRRLVLHGVLFVLTLLTTVLAGDLLWQGFSQPPDHDPWGALFEPENLLQGLLTFSLPLLAILAIHESAHFIAARRHGMRPTLPFFLPVPPGLGMPIGTLGALINLRDPMPHRKALFDVGLSGPLAGFAAAIPILLIGLALTNAAAIPVPDVGRPEVQADVPFTLESGSPGQTILRITDPAPGTFSFNVTAPADQGDWAYRVEAAIETEDGPRAETADGVLAPGAAERRTFTIPAGATVALLTITWDSGLLHFGDPLFVWLLNLAGFGSGNVLTHPTWIAGWVGILVTGLNLLPLGQLDGGHVARAVLGDRMKLLAYGAMGLLVFLTLQYQAWFLFTLLLLVMGIQHPPPLDERSPLGRGRTILAWVALAVLVLTFVPVPFHS